MIRRLCVLLVLLSATGAAAQEATSTVEPRPACDTCHLDVIATWSGSPHAQAYQDDAFQAAWLARRQDGTCLACHTTGFVERTGQYDHEGVSCAACHGDTPADHPPEAVLANPGSAACGECHPTTLNEWEISRHAETLTCTTCHQMHPQTLAAESADALCVSCHTEPLNDYIHDSHPETSCVDCHWHRQEVAPEHFVSGALLPTGHDNRGEPQACSDCHAELNTDWQVVATSLEARPAGAEATDDAAPVTSPQLIMGLLLGAGIGIVFGVVFSRHRRGS